MIVTLNEVKKHIRVELDYTEEDDYIQLLADSAEKYLYNATSKVFDSSNNLAKLYICCLCDDWYNNRGYMECNKVTARVRFTLQSMLTQLKYCEV